MSDDKYEQPQAVPLPDKAKLIAELHSEIQLNELKHAGPTAPSYEEAISCSYPALPAASSSMPRAEQPMHQSPPYSSSSYSSAPVVRQPHSGNIFLTKFFREKFDKSFHFKAE